MSDFYIEKENQIIAQTGMEFFRFEFTGTKRLVRPHIHSAVEILLIVDGCFRVFSENQEHLANPGETVLFRPNTIHRIYQESERGCYYVLKLHPSFISGLLTEERAATYLLNLSLYHEGARIFWSKEESDSLGIKLLRDRLIFEAEGENYGTELALKLFGAEILLILLRQIGQGQTTDASQSEQNELLTKRIYDAIVYVNKHYSEEITVEECSRRLYMSYSYFSRKFKEITGKSFKNYLNITRINHAEKALLSTEKPITQIALECGFNNLAYFSATYKKIKGKSPSSVREQLSV